MLDAHITWISPIKQSRHGGCYRIVALKIITGEEKQAKVFVDNECRNYKNWEPILQKGNVIGGLVWKDEEARIIDADSPVFLL